MIPEDFAKAQSVIEKVINKAKAAQSHATYHAFFVAMDYKVEQARTYELTLVKNENSIVGLLTRKTHEVDAKDAYNFYFETYSSDFGLPFIFSEKAENTDAELTEDMISYMRQYLLRAAEQTRGSNMKNFNINKNQLQGYAG